MQPTAFLCNTAAATQKRLKMYAACPPALLQLLEGNQCQLQQLLPQGSCHHLSRGNSKHVLCALQPELHHSDGLLAWLICKVLEGVRQVRKRGGKACRDAVAGEDLRLQAKRDLIAPVEQKAEVLDKGRLQAQSLTKCEAG